MSAVPIDDVVAYLKDLQVRLCAGFEEEDGSEKFRVDGWKKAPGSQLGGEGSSRILEGGVVFERAGVGFSDVTGSSLPPSATERNPALAGRPFRAVGVSVVMHPRNPYAPTSHMNVRCFTTLDGAGWWFGGGFDLTPYYPFDEDVRAWHQTAFDACKPFGDRVYPLLKERCDSYFFLGHRNETRGVGGLFVDDLNTATPEIGGDPAHCFGLIRAIGDGFLAAYRPIIARRKNTSYGQREREFQLYRRGRYVEFNLVFDRGTLFGLQSKGRTESILMSMPPLVSWRYDYQPEAGSAEAKLNEYLKPREWLSRGENVSSL